RRSLGCSNSGISPISSSSSVPPSASSNLPVWLARAPVKAPRTWPNNSASRRFSGTAAQLMATNGLAARELSSWTRRASSSLPVPLSASSRMSAPLRAACRACSSAASSAGELPIIGMGLLVSRGGAGASAGKPSRNFGGAAGLANCELGNICLPLLHGACRLRPLQIRPHSREVTANCRQLRQFAARQTEVLGQDGAAFGENGSALDHVLQLAHV